MRENLRRVSSPEESSQRARTGADMVKIPISCRGETEPNFPLSHLVFRSFRFIYRLGIHDTETGTRRGRPFASIDEWPAESSTRDTCNSSLTSGMPRYFICERESERANVPCERETRRDDQPLELRRRRWRRRRLLPLRAGGRTRQSRLE